MRLAALLLSIAGLLGLAACGSSTTAPKVAAAACSWHAQNPGPGTTDDLTGLSFPDNQHGWAVGGIDGAVIRVTSDGGKVWHAQHAPGTNGLNEVSFPDDTHGWAVGIHNTLFATTNGGRTWRRQDPGVKRDGNLYGVSFVDDSRGWIVGSGGVIETTRNGGRTWTPEQSPTHADLLQVSFTDPDHGWIMSTDNELLSTTNGGATWSKEFAANGQHGQILANYFFLDPQHGWVSGSQDDGNANHGVIARTSDAGRTWTAEDVKYFEDVRFNALAFTDDQHGWMSGYQGELWYTDDGGKDWGSRATPSQGNRIDEMEFRDATHGWAVGQEGTIIACTA